MEYKKYLVEIYGSHDLFARNEREAREKTVDWLQQHWCFISFDVQEFDAMSKEPIGYNNITPELFEKFNSLKYFQTLGYEVTIDPEAITLYSADDAKSIALSIKPSSQRTYITDSCLSGENGGLSRDELKGVNWFWEEYDKHVEIYVDEGK